METACISTDWGGDGQERTDSWSVIEGARDDAITDWGMVMAGDWIKMRVWLNRDPKVIAIAQCLSFDRRFMDWLSDPVQRQCDDSALEHVTLDCVTRIVTCGLLNVWGVANERGKISGKDLLLRYSSRTTIDEIASLPGLAAAMESVGWLVVDETTEAVTFPDFMVYNVPSEDRKREKAKKRQAKYRQRHATDPVRNNGVTHSVTDASQSNAREEESKSIKETKAKKVRTAFQRPTLEEVREYCEHRDNHIDPELFLAHYDANGWVQGKTLKPIQSWRAAIVTWERNGAHKPESRVPTKEDLENWNPVNGGLDDL